MSEGGIKGEKSCHVVTRAPSASANKQLREDLVSLCVLVEDRSWTAGIQYGWWGYTSVCVETKVYIFE